MRNQYQYDVFISFSHEDEDKVRLIYDKVTDFGIRAFWSRQLPRGKEFLSELEKALKNSQHFVMICTESASKSNWVSQEWQMFFDLYHLPDKENRRMHVLLNEKCDQKLVPDLLQNLNRPTSTDELIAALVRAQERDYKQTIIELERQKQKVVEAQYYYRYNRFWGPIAKNGHVHIFTCGRDVTHDPDSSRGVGGRTNIDMWDYRAVLDITHFFASNYPNTRITIEDPISKLPSDDLESTNRLANHIASMRSRLGDKDCIIIGSPDVNDFAEVVLAEINQMDPYTTEGRLKKKGFVVIKELKFTRSSCYWKKKENEKEGVAQILDKDDYLTFPHEFIKQEESVTGKIHGVLIVANNPFNKNEQDRKIVILSGFSGVATNAIAKLLTTEKYLEEFFKLDNAFTNTDKNIEALVGAEYIADKNFEYRDTRQIKSITFERLVEI